MFIQITKDNFLKLIKKYGFEDELTSPKSSLVTCCKNLGLNGNYYPIDIFLYSDITKEVLYYSNIELIYDGDKLLLNNTKINKTKNYTYVEQLMQNFNLCFKTALIEAEKKEIQQEFV